MRSYIIGIDLIRQPTRITLFGLGAAMLACGAALRGEWEVALALLVVSGVADLFDGWVARRTALTDDERRFGVQIDTVTDMAAFGVTPAIIVISVAADWILLAAAVTYAVCAAHRLAFFNLKTATISTGAITTYWGLPVTYAALVFPVAFIPIAELQGTAYAVAVTLLTLALAASFVLRIRIPKPTGLWYPSFAMLAVAVAGYWLAKGFIT